MKRQTLLLCALVAVLVVALYWLTLFKPQREELEQVQAQIVAQEAQQRDLETQLLRLRDVRNRAPEIEAELAAASAVIPDHEALPRLLSLLQSAGDDSGVTIQGVTTGRPNLVAGTSPEVASIDVTLQLQGGYFQLVDFLRRIEDPAITPRGMQWTTASLSRGEYPTLNLNLGARVFASVPADPAPAEAPGETEPDDGSTGDADGVVAQGDGGQS
jgi:Tfp pilus assembly protein PilO